MSTVVLTGGGTAGHVTACLALLPNLYAQFDSVHYIGSCGGIEKELLAPHPRVIYHEIPCTKLRRSATVKNLAVPFLLFKSICAAKKVLKTINPDVIFGKGGYVTLPVALAAGDTPLVLHESDRSMGLANRIASKHAKVICTTFEMKGDKCLCTGTPLRQELYKGDATNVRELYRIDRPLLLVMGGSQGATRINDAVRENLTELTRKFFVIHLTGKGKAVPISRPRYVQIEYTAAPADLFVAADVVVTRGGANTLFELAALKKSMLIIPLPKGNGSRGDQEENAAYFKERGLVSVLSQEDLTDIAFLAAIHQAYEQRLIRADALKSFRADGTEEVFRQIVKYSQRIVI